MLGHFHHNTNRPIVSSLRHVCRTERVGKSVHLSRDGRGAKEYNQALEKSLMDEKVVSVFISMVAEQSIYFFFWMGIIKKCRSAHVPLFVERKGMKNNTNSNLSVQSEFVLSLYL